MNKTDILESTKDIKITLSSISSIWARIILGILSLISSLGLLVAILNPFRSPQFVFLEFFVPFIIMSVSTIYCVRLFLWNQFGKEIIIISPDKYLFYHDYAWFQSDKEEIKYTHLQASIASSTANQSTSDQTILDEELLGKKEYLLVELGEEKHQSSIPLPRKEISDLVRFINEYYHKTRQQ